MMASEFDRHVNYAEQASSDTRVWTVWFGMVSMSVWWVWGLFAWERSLALGCVFLSTLIGYHEDKYAAHVQE